MNSVRPAGSVRMWQKLERSDFLGHCKSDKCQTLHDGTTHWAYPFVPLSVTMTVFQGHSSQTASTENFMFLSDYVEALLDCWLRRVDHDHVTILFFTVFKGDNGHISLSKTTTNQTNSNIAFFRHSYSEIFQTLHDYNLARGSAFSLYVWWHWLCFKVTGMSEM